VSRGEASQGLDFAAPVAAVASTKFPTTFTTKFPSKGVDIAAIAFQFDSGDAVHGHVHPGKPEGERLFAGGFHHANGFALGQVGKTAIASDDRIVLRRLRKLADLLGRKFSWRNGVSAHEPGHRCFFRLLLVA
jgi:hypothetical protein